MMRKSGLYSFRAILTTTCERWTYTSLYGSVCAHMLEHDSSHDILFYVMTCVTFSWLSNFAMNIRHAILKL